MLPSDLEARGAAERANWKSRRIRCCTAAGCLALQSADVLRSLETAVAEVDSSGDVDVAAVGCLKLCGRGPLVAVDVPRGEEACAPEGCSSASTLYAGVRPQQAAAIVAAALTGEAAAVPQIDLQDPFFSHQLPLVLEHCGHVEPLRLESSLGFGAYRQLAAVLQGQSPGEVVQAVVESGLRGRGGAGYPTGLKWGTVAKANAPTKYVICNADEGDPGAFKDRTILESDPHRVLEGMAIAGYGVGAEHGFVYVRGEFRLAIERLETALRQARESGLLGGRILGTGFNFQVELRIGAGAFVCGEETALMASIEGGRGTPVPRPPYPAEVGLWGCPTLINNVETMATIPPLLRRGPQAYASIGYGKSRGTKVFSVSGHVRCSGLVEVPMGTPLRKIVEEMAGGAPEGRTIKAVQTGGPSGGCIPAGLLHTPVDYEAFAALGSIVGSGGMVVMDDQTSMVEVARFFMDFCRDESCGKCIPCRAGTVQLHRLLSRLAAGQGSPQDLVQLEQLADMVKHTSLCGLGQSAPNPVQSTLRHFRGEYEAAIAGKMEES